MARGRRRLAAAMTGVLVLAGVIGAGGGDRARAAYPGGDGRIALVRHGNIYTVEVGGQGVTRLTTGGGSSGPRWSPDGAEIAYVHDGDLWEMRADGSHQTRLTARAPALTDARPSWSPSGRYLAFVETRRGHSTGRLVRYNTRNGHTRAFTTTINSRVVDVTALPAAVAWTVASNGSYYLAFEGVGTGLCNPLSSYCLDLLGFTHQSQLANGYPSVEETTAKPTRWLDPDWYPRHPRYYEDLLVTVETCPASCHPVGIETPAGIATSPPAPPAPPTLPGAYEAVYSPDGDQIAYVQEDAGGVPTVYVTYAGRGVTPPLTVVVGAGTEPDWQPLNN